MDNATICKSISLSDLSSGLASDFEHRQVKRDSSDFERAARSNNATHQVASCLPAAIPCLYPLPSALKTPGWRLTRFFAFFTDAHRSSANLLRPTHRTPVTIQGTIGTFLGT